MSARLAFAMAGCAALLAAGCTGKPAGDASAVPAAANAAVAAPAAPVEAPPPSAPVESSQRLRGQAVLGKDGYGIVPCGSDQQRILEIDPAAQAFLDKFFLSDPREFFIDAWSREGGNGRLRVTAFERLYVEGAGCDEPLEGISFAARGTEPFWSVSIGREGMSLERPGVPAVVAVQAELRNEGAQWFASAKTASGELSLQLSPEACSDGMSDTLYAWTAVARLGDEEFHGCGFRGTGQRQR